MLIHFSVFAGYIAPVAGLVVPIVLWQIKKDEMPAVDAHGKMVVNFILTAILYFVVCFALTFVLIGIPMMIALVGRLYRSADHRRNQGQRRRVLAVPAGD